MNARRFVCVVLGLWLGASLFMTFVAVMNFRMVSETLANPQPELAAYLKVLGPERLRMLFRHEAAEVNRALFQQWGFAQIGFAVLNFGLLLFATKEGKYILAGSLVLLLVVCIQQFAITPGIIGYGRGLDFLPPDAELVLRKRVATLHSAYSTMEVIKLLGVLGLLGMFLRERPLRKA